MRAKLAAFSSDVASDLDSLLDPRSSPDTHHPFQFPDHSDPNSPQHGCCASNASKRNNGHCSALAIYFRLRSARDQALVSKTFCRCCSCATAVAVSNTSYIYLAPHSTAADVTPHLPLPKSARPRKDPQQASPRCDECTPQQLASLFRVDDAGHVVAPSRTGHMHSLAPLQRSRRRAKMRRRRRMSPLHRTAHGAHRALKCCACRKLGRARMRRSLAPHQPAHQVYTSSRTERPQVRQAGAGRGRLFSP